MNGNNLIAYGLEPGGAKRMSWENRIHEEVAPTLRAQMGDNQASVIVFTQNQREEVRNLGDVAGSLAAEPGIHQQTYICVGS